MTERRPGGLDSGSYFFCKNPLANVCLGCALWGIPGKKEAQGESFQGGQIPRDVCVLQGVAGGRAGDAVMSQGDTTRLGWNRTGMGPGRDRNEHRMRPKQDSERDRGKRPGQDRDETEASRRRSQGEVSARVGVIRKQPVGGLSEKTGRATGSETGRASRADA